MSVRAPVFMMAIVFAGTVSSAAIAKDKLPPCDPAQTPPPGGCMRQGPAPGTPAPPLTPPGTPNTPATNSPAVITPPPSADADIAKPTPPSGDKMPVVKPPANVEAK